MCVCDFWLCYRRHETIIVGYCLIFVTIQLPSASIPNSRSHKHKSFGAIIKNPRKTVMKSTKWLGFTTTISVNRFAWAIPTRFEHGEEPRLPKLIRLLDGARIGQRIAPYGRMREETLENVEETRVFEKSSTRKS